MKRIRPKIKETALGGDWRHAIFKRVVSPPTAAQNIRPTSLKTSASTSSSSSSSAHHPTVRKVIDFKRSREEIRELWRNAIRQQILLNRMDKQNYMIKAKQEEVFGKRVKLAYANLGTCDDEASDTWDAMIQNPEKNCDLQLLNSAILRGIPKHKRGQVWQFFIQQRKKEINKSGSEDYSPNNDISYDQLRRQLTCHQHAILIDLGRTFPAHPFFSDPLGTGQLALFNLLKAYANYDKAVGYCQGLTFVAGMLLMHLEEEEAFAALKYLMFDLGARQHYKPDMSGLQVKLYQLTRMIHDEEPQIQVLLYQHDVLPSLYAAPWFLTFFASTFDVGFALKVLDMTLLNGMDMLTKFAVAVVVDHKNDLMKATSLEQVMECFRHVVTKLGSDDVDRYLRKVLESDSDKQLLTYAVEYSVMQDDNFVAFINSTKSPPTSASSSIKGKRQVEKPAPPSKETTDEQHKLHLDIITLLNYVECMQETIRRKFGDVPPCPPEIQNLAIKYFPEKKFGNGVNYNNNNDDRLGAAETPVQLLCPDSSIFKVLAPPFEESKGENTRKSIDLPILETVANQDDDTESNDLAQNYF